MGIDPTSWRAALLYILVAFWLGLQIGLIAQDYYAAPMATPPAIETQR